MCDLTSIPLLYFLQEYKQGVFVVPLFTLEGRKEEGRERV